MGWRNVARPLILIAALCSGLASLTAGAQQARSGVRSSAPRAQPPIQAGPSASAPALPAAANVDDAAREARVNAWTVGVAGGLLEGSFIRYAADLAKVLDDGDKLRVVPIVSYGAVGNIPDLVYLKGVDLAITYADALDYYKTVDKIADIGHRVQYVIPLFQGEVHIYARPEIKTLRDLAGKKVNFNTIGSAANYTGGLIFDRLGIKVERLFLNNAVALERMATDDIAAIVHVVAKPNDLFAQAKPQPGFHFLPLEFNDAFQDYYVPAQLTSADYPQLIAKTEPVPTISVMALLAVHNWQGDADRMRRCQRFAERLVERFDQLRAPPYQSGWREVNLAGTIPGWTRFPPMQALLDKVGAAKLAPSASGAAALDPVREEQLFEQFLQWKRQQER